MGIRDIAQQLASTQQVSREDQARRRLREATAQAARNRRPVPPTREFTSPADTTPRPGPDLSNVPEALREWAVGDVPDATEHRRIGPAMGPQVPPMTFEQAGGPVEQPRPVGRGIEGLYGGQIPSFGFGAPPVPTEAAEDLSAMPGPGGAASRILSLPEEHRGAVLDSMLGNVGGPVRMVRGFADRLQQAIENDRARGVGVGGATTANLMAGGPVGGPGAMDIDIPEQYTPYPWDAERYTPPTGFDISDPELMQRAQAERLRPLDIYMQQLTEPTEDIAVNTLLGGGRDIAQAIWRAGRDIPLPLAGPTLGEVASEITGRAPWEPYPNIPEIERPEQPVLGALRTAIPPVVSAVAGAGIAGAGGLGPWIGGAVGSMMDAVIIPPEDPNMSSWIQENWPNAVTDFLATNPEDPDFANRARNFAEGMAFVSGANAIFKAIDLATTARGPAAGARVARAVAEHGDPGDARVAQGALDDITGEVPAIPDATTRRMSEEAAEFGAEAGEVPAIAAPVTDTARMNSLRGDLDYYSRIFEDPSQFRGRTWYSEQAKERIRRMAEGRMRISEQRLAAELGHSGETPSRPLRIRPEGHEGIHDELAESISRGTLTAGLNELAEDLGMDINSFRRLIREGPEMSETARNSLRDVVLAEWYNRARYSWLRAKTGARDLGSDPIGQDISYIAEETWESWPGITFESPMHQYPVDAQARYHNDVVDILTDDTTGADRIAQVFGIRNSRTSTGPGVFEGRVSPGAQTYSLGIGGELTQEARNRMTAAALTRGRLLNQDAVAWHTVIPAPRDVAFTELPAHNFELGRTLTRDEATSLVDNFRRVRGEYGLDDIDLTPISTPSGFRVINFGEVADNESFARATMRTVEETFDDIDIPSTSFRVDGEYFENDWRVNPNGESYQQGLDDLGRGFRTRSDDALRRISPEIQAARERLSKRFGPSGTVSEGAVAGPARATEGAGETVEGVGTGGGAAQGRAAEPAEQQTKALQGQLNRLRQEIDAQRQALNEATDVDDYVRAEAELARLNQQARSVQQQMAAPPARGPQAGPPRAPAQADLPGPGQVPPQKAPQRARGGRRAPAERYAAGGEVPEGLGPQRAPVRLTEAPEGTPAPVGALDEGDIRGGARTVIRNRANAIQREAAATPNRAPLPDYGPASAGELTDDQARNIAKAVIGGSSPEEALEQAGITITQLDEPDAIAKAIAEAQDGFRYARRGRVPVQQSIESAAHWTGRQQKKLMNRLRGEAFNEEQLAATVRLFDESKMELAARAAEVQRLADAGQDISKTQAAEQLYEAMIRNGAIQEQLMGARAEAGRALRILRDLKQSYGPISDVADQQEVFRTLYRRATGGFNVPGNQNKIAALAQDIVHALDGGDNARIGTLSRAAAKTNFWDKLHFWRAAALLSGVRTHVTNMVGNALSIVMDDIADLGASMYGMFSRREDKIYMREVLARIAGQFDGIRGGLRSARNAWDDWAITPSQTDKAQQTLYRPATRGGRALATPLRALSAEDAFYRHVASSGQYAADAWHEGIKRGLRGQELREFAREMMGNPTTDMLRRADNAARRGTFTEEPWEFVRRVNRIAHGGGFGGHVLKWLVPFRNTPANLIRRAIEFSPANLARPAAIRAVREGGAEGQRAISRATVGGMLGALAWYMVDNGLITGAGPSEMNQRRIWRTENQPYSFRVGDQWVSYQRMTEPFAMWIGTVADAHGVWDELNTAREQDRVLGDIFGSAVHNMTNRTWFTGFTDFIEAMDAPERRGATWLGRQVGSLVPTAAAHAAQGMDPYLRDGRGVINPILRRIPGATESITPWFNYWGEPIELGGPIEEATGSAVGRVLDLGHTAYSLRSEGDPASLALIEMGYDGGLPSRRIAGVELTDDEHYQYVRLAHGSARNQLNRIVQSPTWERLNADQKETIVDDLFRNARRAAREHMLRSIPDLRQRYIREQIESRRDAA